MRLRPRLPSPSIRFNYNCHINEVKRSGSCLTNHKGSISHHITLLVINSLGGGHTDTYTDTQAYQLRGQKATSRNQARQAGALLYIIILCKVEQ